MARQPLIRTAEHPYHLCARTNNRDWFELPAEVCWEILRHNLKKVHDRYGFELHEFVLMSNHWHCLGTTPEANVDRVMQYFMTNTSRQMARASGRINKIYGSRYSWTVITHPKHYAAAYRYVLMNPVRAGICERPDQHLWSTFNNPTIEKTPCLGYEEFIPNGPDLVEWMIAEAAEAERVRRALRRCVFKYPRDEKTKRRPK